MHRPNPLPSRSLTQLWAESAQLSAGGTLTLVATGSGAPGTGDIQVIGSTLQAGETLQLEATNDIWLLAAEQSLSQREENKSSGWNVGVGISLGSGGWSFGITAGGNLGKGFANTDATTWYNTVLEGGHVSLIGGAIASTNPANSELSAYALTFSDIQNVMSYDVSSFGLGLSYGNQGPDQQPTSGVPGQIQKFVDGFKDGVKTETKNGVTEPVIGKDGKPVPINAGTWSDEKKSPASLGITAALPIHESGGDQSTTYATLTEGNIMIGGQLTNAVDTGIHTDLSDANTGIDELPKLNVILSEQRAMASAISKVSTVVKQVVKDVTDYPKKEAEAAYRNSLDEKGKEEFDTKLKGFESGKEREDYLIANVPGYEAAADTAKEWGSGGDYGLALQAVTTVVLGSVAGQGDAQIAANALAPIATKLIGENFDPHTGKNPNAALDVLSRVLLGAVLAEVNGHNPALGAVATAGGELAMHYLFGKLYKDDDKVKGDMSKLTQDQKKTLEALAQATGALAGWLAGGGNGADAATGANIAKNALANIAKKPNPPPPAASEGK